MDLVLCDERRVTGSANPIPHRVQSKTSEVSSFGLRSVLFTEQICTRAVGED